MKQLLTLPCPKKYIIQLSRSLLYIDSSCSDREIHYPVLLIVRNMTSSTTPATVIAVVAESTTSTKNSAGPPPPRPPPPSTSTIIRRRDTNTNTNPHNHQYYARGRHSIEDFQDGKRFSAAENTSILHVGRSVGVAFRNGFLNPSKNNNGNKKNDTTTIGTGTSRNSMNTVRHSVGLYLNYPLANSILDGASKREIAFKLSGIKQMNHVRGTDGWFKSMFVLEVRAIDNYLGPWIVICINALIACLLSEVFEIRMPEENLQHWDTVYSLILKTSLAFLLVFRLNRCAMRYWEARTVWGNITHNTRNLVGALLLYGSSSDSDSDTDNLDPKSRNRNRDGAIRWGSSFCVACKHFIRSNHDYPINEFAGFLTNDQIIQLKDSNHSPLFAASMCRQYLSKMFYIDSTTPPGLAHAYTIRLQECETYISSLVEAISGMEKIRSTPLPIAYVTHLRTFLFAYCILLPYIWVSEWSWGTIPLCAFTTFALFGIEGASSEVEIPFRKERPNHLAMDAYCLVIMDSVLGLVVHDANMHIQGGVTEYDNYYTDEDDDDGNDNCDGDGNVDADEKNHHTTIKDDIVDDIVV